MIGLGLTGEKSLYITWSELSPLVNDTVVISSLYLHEQSTEVG